jgi:hypothetical protein
MPVFDQARMSPDERQFIRTYCITLQREYDLLQIIRGLLDPDNFGVPCVITASKLAKKLYAEQLDFVARLYAVGEKSGNRPPTKKDITPPELVATIFTQSFFKLVDSETKQVFITDKALPPHDGWSSGHPIDWQHSVNSMHEIYKQKLQSKKLSENVLVNALLKLFSILPTNLPPKVWADDDELYDDEEWADDEDEDPDETDFDIDPYM